MKYISGIEKVRELGGIVKCDSGNGIEIAVPIEIERKLDIRRFVKCIKCGDEMQFIVAMYDKKTDKPYCPKCCGYTVDRFGEVVESDESEFEVRSSSMLQLGGKEAKDFIENNEINLKLTLEQIEYLEEMLSIQTQGMMEFFKEKLHKLDGKTFEKINNTISENTAILISIQKALGKEVDISVVDAVEMMKKLSKGMGDIMDSVRQKKTNKKPSHENCICPECRKSKNDLN